MSGLTRWWWLRHAPIPGASDGRLFGALDVGCDTGDAVAFAALAARLPPSGRWVLTPLKRTRATFDAILAAGHPAPAVPPLVEPALAEQHFGRWQGLTWAEMAAQDPAAHADFWRDPTGRAPPEGESFADVIARVAAAVNRLTEALQGCDIIAVAHGGSIRAALALALGLTPAAALALVIDNLSLTRISHLPGGGLGGRGAAWRVEGVNLPPGAGALSPPG
jgi:alpha-ribazole phosphatase